MFIPWQGLCPSNMKGNYGLLQPRVLGKWVAVQALDLTAGVCLQSWNPEPPPQTSSGAAASPRWRRCGEPWRGGPGSQDQGPSRPGSLAEPDSRRPAARCSPRVAPSEGQPPELRTGCSFVAQPYTTEARATILLEAELIIIITI